MSLNVQERQVRRRRTSNRPSTALVSAVALTFACISFLTLIGCGVGAAPASTPPPTNNGGSGTLSSSVPSLSFGSVTVGTSTTQTVKISNVGTAAISISSISISGSGFSVSGVTTPVSLSPSQSVNATVKFAPTAAGSVSGSLNFTTDTQGKNLSIPLTATAVNPGTAQLSANPSSVTFGNITVSTSSSKSVTVTNVGTATASIGSVTYSGAGFNVSGVSAPLTLASGQGTSFTVLFAPSSAGASSGSILFKDGSGATLLNLGMSGTGVAAAAHSVDLRWTASTSSVSGYRVYRGTTTGGPYTLLTTTLITTNSYHDAAVVAGNHYFYVVTAVDASNVESGFSNEVSVTIPNP